MKTTLEYLQAVKEKLGIESDYALANALDLTREAISSYKLKKSIMNDDTCAKVAEILEIDVFMLITLANYERSKTEDRKRYWSNLYQTAAKNLATALSIVVVSLGLISMPNEAKAEGSNSTLSARYTKG